MMSTYSNYSVELEQPFQRLGLGLGLGLRLGLPSSSSSPSSGLGLGLGLRLGLPSSSSSPSSGDLCRALPDSDARRRACFKYEQVMYYNNKEQVTPPPDSDARMQGGAPVWIISFNMNK
jgi:hypothetical protein